MNKDIECVKMLLLMTQFRLEFLDQLKIKRELDEIGKLEVDDATVDTMKAVDDEYTMRNHYKESRRC